MVTRNDKLVTAFLVLLKVHILVAGFKISEKNEDGRKNKELKMFLKKERDMNKSGLLPNRELASSTYSPQSYGRHQE